MDILKSTSKPSLIPNQSNTGRRSFMWKMGAAMSAVLVSVVPGMSRPRINQDTGLKARVNQLSSQLEILEDENAIRKLHQSYESLLDNRMYEEVVNMFTNDGEVIFNGGLFRGKFRGVRRLYCDHFRLGLTGKKIEPVPGFQPDIEQHLDIVQVATDRKTARARFAYSIQVGTPIISDSTLVKMARLHGEGIMKWWEGGTYEISYAKNVKNGRWKIKRLEFQVLSKSDYRPGRSYAKPISVPLFSKVYPEDSTGPDRLITLTQVLRKA